MTSKKTAIIAVCGVTRAIAAIMTAVLYKNGNTQDIEPFDMEEDLFSDEEDELESEQDEQIHDVRAILNGKLDWSAFTSERAYELAPVMFDELTKLPDKMTKDMRRIKEHLVTVFDELIQITSIDLFREIFSVNECGKLPACVYDEVKNKMLDIHMEEFEYPDIYL